MNPCLPRNNLADRRLADPVPVSENLLLVSRRPDGPDVRLGQRSVLVCLADEAPLPGGSQLPVDVQEANARDLGKQPDPVRLSLETQLGSDCLDEPEFRPIIESSQPGSQRGFSALTL